MVVYKYTIQPQEVNKIEVPRYCKVLSVKEQRDEIVIYVLGDEKERREAMLEVLVLPTGFAIAQNLVTYTFLDTVNLKDGALMFHIFYKL